MIRIGTNPVLWSNDDLPELGAHIGLDRCLTEAAAAGYRGIELGNKFPRTAAALRPILDRHGLDLVSGWYSTFLLERDAEAEFAAARGHVDLLKAMGCRVFIAAECTGAVQGDRSKPLSARPVMTDAEWARFNRRLTRLAERLAAEGLVLAYHHHMGTVVETGADIDRMMAGTGPAVRLLLDTGHARWAGADPADLARRHRARIAHVHAKDLRAAVMDEAARADWSFLDAVVSGVYTVPGDGMVDFTAVLRELPDYAGWIVVEAEQDPDKANPMVYARMGHDNLVRFLAEAGLTR
jgi:myo-inosose-2 dehydratase